MHGREGSLFQVRRLKSEDTVQTIDGGSDC